MTAPTFSSDLFTWKGNRATSHLETLGIQNFPADGFNILSSRSGEIRFFAPDPETMEENDFFDGEAQAYMCNGLKVQIWT